MFFHFLFNAMFLFTLSLSRDEPRLLFLVRNSFSSRFELIVMDKNLFETHTNQFACEHERRYEFFLE